MKKIGLVFLSVIVILAILLYINPQLKPSHTSPYELLQGEVKGDAPTEEMIQQRVLLFGDAGHSTIDPWQSSLAGVARRAAISPDKTTVVALGDNIYMRGYPQKDAEQVEWDEDQLESISFLDAQLQVAKESGARMFLVPGNHDWYATEVDSQAAHIARYARQHELDVRFEPYEPGLAPVPESVDLPGVSLIFIDSEWLLRAEGAERVTALEVLDAQLARIRSAAPENLIVMTAHHPLDTMGPHGGYLAEFGYWLVMNLLYTFTEASDEDVFSDIYKRMISDVNQVASGYERVIYAAGHEHSLQVFRREHSYGPEYTLVSGAANTNKVSGVWHNESTRFALAEEGFMELEVTGDGEYLKIFRIGQPEPVSEFWLSF